MLNEWGYGHTNKDVMATVGKENGWGPLESYTEGPFPEAFGSRTSGKND